VRAGYSNRSIVLCKSRWPDLAENSNTDALGRVRELMPDEKACRLVELRAVLNGSAPEFVARTLLAKEVDKP
jgi:hypothetical protein